MTVEQHEKILEMLMDMGEDDIKDADMLLEYAQKCEIIGDKDTAKLFANRAKRRIYTDFDESHNAISKCMTMLKDELTKNSSEEQEERITAENKCWNIVHEKYMTWVNKIRMGISSFLAR
jgi:hypothetical protein